jgi:glycosyltransferase involved in cell wall biosynthesis
VRQAWADFDIAVHVPLSENCGGVLEPLLAGVPTIAGRVGGLPEVVMDGVSGRLVPIRRPDILAKAISEVIEDRQRYVELATRGKALVEEMFDYRRTAGEIADIYRYVLEPSSGRPAEFDSVSFLKEPPVT